VSVAGFITCQRTEHPVPHPIACRARGVSESWFYKWRTRPVQAELREAGWRVSAKTLAAIMRERGLVARPKCRLRRCPARTRLRRRCRTWSARTFTAAAADLKWSGDITEIPTSEGKLPGQRGGSVSGRLLGHAMGEHHEGELVWAALLMAATVRGGTVTWVIVRSDRATGAASTPRPSEPPAAPSASSSRSRAAWQPTGSGQFGCS